MLKFRTTERHIPLSWPDGIRWVCLVALLMLGLGLSPVQADEPYLKFLQGMRARQYYDTALIYLQSLESRPEVPADIKLIIPYERAITLVEGAQFVQNPEAQADQLQLAQASLEKFLKDSPQHPLAAVANTELARIMLGKAQVLVWQAKSPANAENRSKFQQDARKLVQQARVIFQKAHDAYKQEWESYGVYIPEDEVQKRAARSQAEGLYMRAQLDLASCTYEEAQTYDRGSKPYKDTLQKASLEFEDVHNKYRSQYAGLFARTMQGKCFEEQDDIRKALGIYDELLEHPGQSEGLKRLQHQVRHFRQICLNHESRKDYQLVINEGGEWIRLNRAYTRTPTGLGIRWELAQAQEKLAMTRTTAEADRTRLLRQALENAREINKYAGPYKDVSNAMIQRVLVAMNREPGDPADFDTAFGTANNLLEEIGKLRDKLKAAEKTGKKEEITALEGELQAQLSETERLYRLALALADSKTEVSQIQTARYRLAYMFYLERKSLETAVVGQYLYERALKSNPSISLDGAYLAMAGLSQAYNDAPEAAKENILQLLVDVCTNIATHWPDSDRATDARLEMGRVYRRGNNPAEAAKWFSQVPATMPQYADAQLEAGQASWNAYLVAVTSEDSTATNEQLKQWQDDAAKYLQNGINKLQSGLPEAAETPSALTRAKVSLSQIEIMRGKEAQAVELLTKEPHSVVKAISLGEGQARPKEDSNIKSVTFASFAYQQLLRAYIGTRELDKAEQARAELEKVAGATGGEALTAVYIELGRELQNELERLKKQGDQQRLNDVRGGFESFLTKLFERKDGQTYGSLIWIAETYFGLAEGSEENAAKETEYYNSAAKTYEEILRRAAANPSFIDASRVTGVKLRLVNCKRQQKDFAAGETIVKEILKANPRALDAQIEAASLYQSWGNEEDPEKFLNAVKGNTFEDGTVIWGWGNIANRLQLIINGGQGGPEYAEKNREACYRLAQSRFQYAEKSNDLNASEDQLKKARFELLAYASVSPDLPETAWWPKFDQLYQEIQRNLGEAVVPLEKPNQQLLADRSVRSSYDSGETQEPVASAATATPAVAPAPADNTLTYVLFGVILLAGLGGGGYMVLGSGKSKKKASVADRFATAPKSFVMAEGPAPVKKRPRPAAPEAAASATAAPAATATAPLPAAGAAEPKRPRPRPADAASAGEPRRTDPRRAERPAEPRRTERPGEPRNSERPAGTEPDPARKVRRKPPEQS